MKIIIIGGGIGGYSAALYAAKHNAEVVLIEKEKVGGTCLHRGCIPTKSFLKDSNFIASAYEAKASGLFDDICHYQSDVILQNKNETVDKLHQGVLHLLDNHKVQLIYDEASFVNTHEIHLKNANKNMTADAFIIATGSTPRVLNFVELNDKVYTTDQCFDTLPDKTENIVIVGGGVIGLELATFYRQLQHNVTIVEAEKSCASNFDSQAITQLVGLLKKSGVTVLTSAKVQTINNEECIIQLKDSTTRIPYDRCILAVGRQSSFASLHLENANVKTSFGVDINEFNQTNQPHIYAIGDVSGKSWLAHQASAMAKIAVEHIVLKQAKPLLSVPMVIYTTPEIAMVGVSGDQAKSNEQYNVVKVPVSNNGMHMITNHKRGFISIVTDQDERIVGATVFSKSASEIIHIFSLAIDQKLSLKDVSSMVFAHPSLSEPIHDCVNEPFSMALHSLN